MTARVFFTHLVTGELDRLPNSSIRKYSLLSITGNAIGTAALGLVQGRVLPSRKTSRTHVEPAGSAVGPREYRAGGAGLDGRAEEDGWAA